MKTILEKLQVVIDIDDRVKKSLDIVRKSDNKVKELRSLINKLQKNKISATEYEKEFEKIMRKYK